MATFALRRRVAIAAAIVAAPLGCLPPTEAVVDITTDAICTDVNTTGVRAGSLEDLDSPPWGATGSQCTGSGDIGSMVLVPEDGHPKDDTFAIKVVMSLGPDTPIDDCAQPKLGPTCIVARRAMRFVPHGPFHVPVNLGLACAGVTCPMDQTCESGVCVSPTVDPDNCDKPSDCAPPAGVAPPWQQSFGGAGTQLAHYVAANADGTIALTGGFAGEISFGGDTLKAKDGQDIFLATFSQGGQLRWSTSFGGTGVDDGFAVAFGPHGDIYLLASFEDGVDFGGGPIKGMVGSNLALVKMSSFGMFRWAIRVGDSASETAGGVAVDKDDNVYVSGEFSGATIIGGTKLTSAGGLDAFLASFSGAGDPRWATSFGDAGDDGAGAVATDEDGNVYVTGRFNGKVTFGGGKPLTSVGSSDVFLMSVDAGGAFRWSSSFGSKGNDIGLGVAARGGRVAVTGGLSGPATIGGQSVGMDTDGFVAVFKTDGKLAWAKGFGGAGMDSGQGISIAEDGAVVVGGDVFDGKVFNSKPVTLKGNTNPFVAVLEPDGTPRWARVFASSNFAHGSSVAATPGGTAVVAGWFTSDLDAQSTTLSSKGDEDLFLLHVTAP